MNNTTRRVRHLAASVTFAAVAGGLALPLLATPAGAVEDTVTSRLQGDDRYGTAAAVATATFPDGADSVVLATGQKFADALAANGLAGALDAPILLTTTAALPKATTDALTKLDPTTIYVMGGTAAVSQAVEDQLAADYDIERVQGDDRWETAAAAGTAIDDTDDGIPLTDGDGLGETSGGVTAILANGLRFPDAVSGGPIAFAGRLPVLLTEAGQVPAATTKALDDLGIEHVLILGGTAVVSNAVETEIKGAGYTTERLAGNDRWGTNVKVNEYAAAEFDFGGDTAYLSTGAKFADALAGGPAAGTDAAPLVLTATDVLPAPAQDFLEANANPIDAIIAIGGTAAISDATLAAAAAAAKVGNNRVFTVAPGDSAVKPFSSNAFNNDGAREYQASGLEAGLSYVIALVDAETVDPVNGTFTSYSPSDGPNTSIESVNGMPTGQAGGLVETVQAEGTATVQGTLTFVVDATSADRIIPVVYQDLDEDDTLTLVGNTPSEPYGIGGETAWLPEEAANGNSTVVASQVDTERNYFIAGGRTYFYDSGDRLRSKGTLITLGQFEGMLTSGDHLTISYQRAAQSSFDVTLDTIPDISMPVASIPNAADANRVQVTWTPSIQPDVVYTVYRDANGNGVLDAGDPVVSPKGPSTTRQFNEASTTPVRYIVLPEGGTSGEPDTRSNTNQAITFITNQVVANVALAGLENGTTVSHNAGISEMNAGDEWMLHFTRPVTVASNATITVRQGSGPSVTFNRTTATWTVDGASITILLGPAADAAPDITYGADTLVTGLTGVSGGGDTVTAAGLADKVLEDDGPELMVGTSTCDVGDTTCTIDFNEPVNKASAETTSNYTFSGTPARNISSVVLGANGRTITLTFSGALQAADTIRPTSDGLGGLGAGAVRDDDNQPSTQPAFDFVR